MKERPILFSGPMGRAILDGRKTQTRRVVKAPKHILPDGLTPMTWDRHDATLRAQGVSDDARHYLTGPRWEGERLFGNVRGDPGYGVIACPYGQPGDRLWVRETWAPMCLTADPHCWCPDDEAKAKNHYVEYRADTGNAYPGEWPEDEARGYDDAPKWRPSIHMPRSACRLTLEVTGVRVERVRDISEADAAAEGFDSPEFRDKIEELRSIAVGDIPTTYPTPRSEFLHTFFDLNKRAPADSNPWVWVVEFRVVP